MTTASAHHRLEHIMGMPIVVDVCDGDFEEGAIDSVFDWLRFVDGTFSTYKPDSEICRLNRGELALAEAHPAVRSVLARCERLRVATGGYFDPAAPIRSAHEPAGCGAHPRPVDPSGLVKGWAIAGAARILERAGARNYCVNGSGDIRLRGRAPDGGRWRIGIQHPLIRDRVAAVLAASDAGIATSGAYVQGHHIIDPHTGRAPEGVLSVTIVGPDIATADAYATAAYAMGREGAMWCAAVPDYAAMVILADETVLSTAGMSRYRVHA
jgi:thiamine biosynthesis lipoprotein